MSTAIEITGPVLRDRVKRALRADDALRYCYVEYRYIDRHGYRLPEYAATHIRICAYDAVMNPKLVASMAAVIAGMPGCLSTENIERHPTLRPQVIAVFDRRLATLHGLLL